MPPRDDPNKTLVNKPPSTFGFIHPFTFPTLPTLARTPHAWLENKRQLDNIGDFWRIHDSLYDVSSFIASHPGGSEWLELTRGTDITESFETSHVGLKAEQTLKKFFVRNVSTPRNSLFSFEHDGFYRTLKRKAAPVVKEIGTGPTNSMAFIQDGLVVAFLVLSVLTAYFQCFVLAFFTGLIFSMMIITSHNFVHLKDNWRMYFMDLWLITHLDWRLSHVLSHHVYPNTKADWELVVFEPTYVFFPTPKSWLQKYGVLVYFHIANIFVIPVEFLKRIISFIQCNRRIQWYEFLPLLPLILMQIASEKPILTLILFIVIHLSCSYWFMFLSLIGGHRHPDIFIEGDAPRESGLDWGIHQLDSVRDRPEVSGNVFLVATLFGEHGPHHLFPTVDHSKLPCLHGVIEETCKEFGVEYKFLPQWDMFKGLFRQLGRTVPNIVPPGQKEKE